MIKLIKTFFSHLKVWFQNRRAKFRKSEKMFKSITVNQMRHQAYSVNVEKIPDVDASVLISSNWFGKGNNTCMAYPYVATWEH